VPGMICPWRLHEPNLAYNLRPHVQRRAGFFPFRKRKRRPRILQGWHSYNRWIGFSEDDAEKLAPKAFEAELSTRSENAFHLPDAIASGILTVDEVCKGTAHPVEHVSRFILGPAKSFA